MWLTFGCLFNSKKIVHPLNNIPNENKEVSEYFSNYVEEYNEDLNQANTIPISNMYSDDCSVVTSNEPPNIILDDLTPCELILYNEMIKHNVSSFTIRYRINAYYKETDVIAMLPPLSELKYFNGKNVKIQLVVVDELGCKYTTCQNYINNRDGNLYEHHNLGKLNENKKEICEKIKTAYNLTKK